MDKLSQLYDDLYKIDGSDFDKVSEKVNEIKAVKKRLEQEARIQNAENYVKQELKKMKVEEQKRNDFLKKAW